MGAATAADGLARLRAAMTAPGALFEVGDEDVRGVRMPVFRHRARSLRELLERSARFGDRPYLVDGDVRLDFAAHLAHVDAVAAWLQRERGIRPGDRVAIFAANRWEWVVAYWALVSAGAIPAACNGWWTAEEYADAVRRVGPVLVLGDAPRLERAQASGIDLPAFDLDGLAAVVGAHAGVHPDVPPMDEDDPVVLIFTSGTTGRAKAVTVPHRALVGFAQLAAFGEAMGRVAMAGAPVPQAGDDLSPGDESVLITSPLFHTSTLNGAVLLALVSGTSFVLLPGRLEPERVLATIERERVTRWLALGSAGPRVASSPAVGRYDTSSVRYLGVGGAPVSPAVQDALRAAFPSTNRMGMGMGYTSTEAGAVIASIGGAEFLAHPTSTGRINVTTEVELRDADGNAVPHGEYGEVHVRSPYLMLGYWGDPDATAAVLRPGGWLAMGDVARFDDGLLHIDSRARDMILVSAENVSPTEVEYCLEAHPAVVEAAVFAVDDAVTGDAVCAVVNVGADAAPSGEELAAWCRERLAHYKVPTHWHVTHELLPRTASGKLLKHVLRAQVDEPAGSGPGR
jgi:long-chain acyl-CoA synthetase